MNKTCIVIPAYNEESTISTVVDELMEFFDVLLVDDGSTDSTFTIGRIRATSALRNHQNLGYDKTLLRGVLVALEKKYDKIITCDGDGQFVVDDIKKINALLSESSPLVVGIRPNKARFSEHIFSLFGKYFGLQDPLCGLKGYMAVGMEHLSYTPKFDSVGTFLCAQLIKHGTKVKNIKIQLNIRCGPSRFGSGLIPNLRILRALILFVRTINDK
jgi:glycosyltransferase involved in cell wall biosynthesis